VFAAAILFAVPAWAERPAWVGYWAENAAWCVHAGSVGDETPALFAEDGLFGIEWSCDIQKISETGVGQSWAVSAKCLDAGFEYTENFIWMLTPYDRLLTLTADGQVSDLVRCAKKPD